ncbi:MAG: hypothetical protein Q7R56_03085 [Nanoarchaeota archaeon]|nr:hypothetical protein [Nanoarchaeota archaeon]
MVIKETIKKYLNDNVGKPLEEKMTEKLNKLKTNTINTTLGIVLLILSILYLAAGITLWLTQYLPLPILFLSIGILLLILGTYYLKR